MKIKELLITFLVAYMSAWAFQYFILDKWFAGGKPAPECRQECKPQLTDISFSDPDLYKTYEHQSTVVTVPWGRVVFSTNGGTIDTLEFNHIADGREILLRTVSSDDNGISNNRNFLVAFQADTPWRYTLESLIESESGVEIVYRARNASCDIQKKFVVHKGTYGIDLYLQIIPHAGHTLVPHLLVNAPVMKQVGVDDQQDQLKDAPSGITYCGTTFSKTAAKSIAADQCWQQPTLIGADSRYFVHALVSDSSGFVQRGYYWVRDGQSLTTIIEGAEISEQSEWRLSFYCGPKELASMGRVDERLENTLDYAGILAPIAKLLVKLLKFFYAFVGNYGFAIVVLTFFAKAVLLPFTYKSEASMRKQAEVQKKLAYLQQRYKDDPDRLNQERAELVRKHGLPGIGGCLPLLFQFPIFIALSRVLYSSIELYQAPMLWIPDLSASDPYYILPIGVTVAMLLQALVTDSKQQLSAVAMALVFGAVTTNFSSGLALYICVSTILGVAQTWVARKFSVA